VIPASLASSATIPPARPGEAAGHPPGPAQNTAFGL
jgi:hypothetical protein